MVFVRFRGRDRFKGTLMWRFSFRFEPVRVTIGSVIMTLAAGLFGFFPNTRIAAGICFAIGILLTLHGFLTLGKSGAIIHQHWSLRRIIQALHNAPERATIQILQTWFPEENFVTTLEHLYRVKKKQFRLRVMIVDPHDEGVIDILGARVKLRGINRARAVGEVTASLENLCALKRAVDAAARSSPRNGDSPDVVDLQIRLYDFLPFGPIYKIGEEVIFAGLYLGHVSSVHGPMIEVRKESCPDLWQVFEDDLRRGWEGSTPYYPAKTRGRTR
jgi:hypothetical protein